MNDKIFKTRTGRTKEQTIKVYSLFLTIVRQKHDRGIEVSLKKLSEQLNIGKNISKNDLPDDIYTADYEVVTSLEYAENWLNTYLRPLRRQRKQNTQNAKLAAQEDTTLGGIFEHEPMMPEMEQMRKDFNDFMQEMTTLINNYKNKLQL